MMVARPRAAGDGWAVRTVGLRKRFGDVVAVDGVDLRVPEESVYVLVGANGAGKSTLFRMLLNLERPSEGSAEVLGLDTGRRGPEARAQAGYVPERHGHGYGWMTSGALLRHASAFYPTWDREYEAELVRALAVPLSRRTGVLSKGEGRRLQLVLALAHRPPVLMLDEPTDGLDAVARKRALGLIAAHLADAPTTVLVATHHVHELDSLGDHVGVLHGGRLLLQLPRSELQRTVLRYRLEVPEAWVPPGGLDPQGLRRSRAGREVQWTLRGEEREIRRRLEQSGARVQEASPLSFEDAALAVLPEELA